MVVNGFRPLPRWVRAGSPAQSHISEEPIMRTTRQISRNDTTLVHSGLERAFTLIELLVVLVIIATLAAFLFPAISRAKYQSQRIRCVSNLHQFGMAIQNFVAANHAYPSIIAGTNSDNPGTWMSQLERGGFDISKPQTNVFEEGVWRCPSAHWRKDWPPKTLPASYGYNGFGTGGNHTNSFGLHGLLVSGWELFGPVPESEVVNPTVMRAIG